MAGQVQSRAREPGSGSDPASETGRSPLTLRGTSLLKGEQQDMMVATAVYVIVIGVLSLVCFLAYGLDKRQAGNGGRRVSERTLHLLAFLGGWPGALMGQRQFRHKTQKAAFRVVFWMVVALHVGIVGAAAYVFATSHPA